MTLKIEQVLDNAEQTVEFGKKLAQEIQAPMVVYLNGDLGAGKTTLSRGIVQGFGFKGNVKSPTYTLVEPYQLADINIYHFDLYRLADPEELEFMGIRDYFSADSVALVEWPEKGMGMLASADIIVNMHYQDQIRRVEILACTDKGEQLLKKLT